MSLRPDYSDSEERELGAARASHHTSPAGTTEVQVGPDADLAQRTDPEPRTAAAAVAPHSFFSRQNLRLVAVPAIGGTLNGVSIGFIGGFAQLYAMGTNCALFRGGPTACSTVSYADCRWYGTAADGYCGWHEVTCRVQYAWGGAAAVFPDESAARTACVADTRCAWSYSAQECQNPSGLSTGNHGIFAGAQVVGSVFGAFFAATIVPIMGSRLTFLVVGIFGMACCVMMFVAVGTDEFWALVPARFVFGLVMGLVGVACPLYVDQNAHPLYKRRLGSLYQTFTALGQCLQGILALGVGQSIWMDRDRDQQVMGRTQSLVGLIALDVALMFVLGVVSRETRAKFHGEHEDEAPPAGAAAVVQLDANEYSYRRMLPRLLMGTTIAASLQLTGINAVTNFAPTIMGNLGVAPLVGNFIVNAWNFVTAVASFPLVGRFTMRQLFLFGSIGTSCMCLFMCGIPVYPGVAKKKEVEHGVAITGLMLFILFYELAVGPCYFVLTQDLFPPSFRPKGASFTQVSMYVFNVIINVCYPIATTNLSGGPSGNQEKGQAITFIFFGGIGIICFVLEVFFLHPWDEEMDGTRSVATLQNKSLTHPGTSEANARTHEPTHGAAAL